jgi:hypothetical protein
MSWACSTYGGEQAAYRVLVGKPKGKSPLGRSRHRWENNFKIHLMRNTAG